MSSSTTARKRKPSVTAEASTPQSSRSKRSKLEAPKPAILKYNITALEHNMRIRLFDTKEFHVHSGLLKIHSVFIREALDTLELKRHVPASSEFDYEWISEAGKDGTWWVRSITKLDGWAITNKKDDNLDKYKLPRNRERDVLAFGRLLCAMYTKPFSVESPDELLRLIRVADLYSALPILSYALRGAISRSPRFIGEVESNLEYVLDLALKLRNRKLYQECIILSVGDWKNPAFKEFKSSLWKGKAQEAHDKLGREVLDTLQNLQMDNLMFDGSVGIIMVPVNIPTAEGLMPLPFFLRVAGNILGEEESWIKGITDLLKNRLVFIRNLRAGAGDRKFWFFCAEADLPWVVDDLDNPDWSK